MKSNREQLADWICNKYRSRARQGSTKVVAKQLRKQGVPMDVALLILGIRSSA